MDQEIEACGAPLKMEWNTAKLVQERDQDGLGQGPETSENDQTIRDGLSDEVY